MTDKTKAQRVAEFRAKVDSAINQMCDPTSPNFARSAVEIRAGMDVIRDRAIEFVSALPDDPPGDAGLLRELRAWIVKQAGNMSPLNDDQWSRAAVQVTQAILGEIDRLLAAAPADKPAETAPAMRVMQESANDCMRACVATYLSIPYSDVPDLSHGDWMTRLRDWLAPRGLGFFSADITEGAFREFASRGAFIVAGKSPRGVQHAVIYRDGALWHDPHPEGGGIERPEHIDLFVPLYRSPDAGTTADERERRIAEWKDRMCSLFFRDPTEGEFDKAVYDGVALMRTAPDSDATRRAERAEAEVARLRGAEEWAQQMGREAQDEAMRLRAEVERLTAWKREAEAAFSEWDKVTAAVAGKVPLGQLKWHAVADAFDRLTKERDGGWAALERLRDYVITENRMIDRGSFGWSYEEHTSPANIVGAIDKALASRPAQGKEAGRG